MTAELRLTWGLVDNMIVVARDRTAKRVLLGGLGVFGVGRMWFDDVPSFAGLPGYDHAREAKDGTVVTDIPVREFGLIAETPGGCVDSYLDARAKHPEHPIPDHFVILQGPGRHAPMPWADYGWYTRTGTTLEQLMEEQTNPVIAGVRIVLP